MNRSAHSRLVLLSFTTALLVSLPSATLAAAPTRQQALNTALMGVMRDGSLATTGQLNVSAQMRPSKGGDSTSLLTLGLGFMDRLQTASGNLRQETRLALNQFSLTGGDGLMNAQLNGEIALQSKLVDGRLYVRLEKIAPSVSEALKNLNMDPTPMLGKWMVFDQSMLNVVGGSMGNASVGSDLFPKTLPSNANLARLSKVNVFTVGRVEKTWKDAAGHELFRARVSLNPSFLNMLQQMETAAVKKDDTNRKQVLAAITSRYTAIRTLVRGMQFVAEVDRTDNLLKRFELGGTVTQPIKSCTTSSSNKQVCRTTGTVLVRYNGGVSLAKDTGPVIAAPTRLNIGIASH